MLGLQLQHELEGGAARWRWVHLDYRSPCSRDSRLGSSGAGSVGWEGKRRKKKGRRRAVGGSAAAAASAPAPSEQDGTASQRSRGRGGKRRAPSESPTSAKPARKRAVRKPAEGDAPMPAPWDEEVAAGAEPPPKRGRGSRAARTIRAVQAEYLPPILEGRQCGGRLVVEASALLTACDGRRR